MKEFYQKILNEFIPGDPAVSCRRIGGGYINETCLTVMESGRKYILQRINRHVFRDVEALMNNICAVTAHLAQKNNDPRGVLHLIPTAAGENFLRLDDGSCYRMYDYVENSICLQLPRQPEDFRQSAVAFGTFQEQMMDFPAQTLAETIPDFHNTPDRYRIFRETLNAADPDRVKEARREIDFALSRQEEAGILTGLLREGKLPLRVTHNDAKLSNVLLDASTGKALCVIDLDTVMPGLSLYDFGDSIRFGASTAAEDERDLSKVELSLEQFELYTGSFLKACPGLNPLERELLPMGAKLMTLECGVRFLTDFLDGDRYFAVTRQGQNLDRCRTQFKLVEDMEQKWSGMQRIIK